MSLINLPQLLTGQIEDLDLCWIIVQFLSPFFCDSKVIATYEAELMESDLMSNSLFFLKKRKFLIHSNLDNFLSWLFTFKYSQDLIPKNRAPVARRLICKFLTDKRFEFICSNTTVGSACWILLLGSNFL